MKELNYQLVDLLENLHKNHTENHQKINQYETDGLFDIASIFFSFRNRELLFKLDERGSLIREGDADKIKAKNKEIQ